MVVRIYKGREFEVLDDVYDPGEDSYLMVDAALKEVNRGERVLEIGTGSGVISMFLKDIADVLAVDVNPHACKNARLNGVEVIRANMFSGICGEFDLVIFNPPYLPTDKDEKLDTWLNEAFDGGPTGRVVIDRFIDSVHGVLHRGSRVMMVISSLTDAGSVSERFERNGFKVEVVSEQNVWFEKLIVLKCSYA